MTGKKKFTFPCLYLTLSKFPRHISKLKNWELQWEGKFNVDKVTYAIGVIYIFIRL